MLVVNGDFEGGHYDYNFETQIPNGWHYWTAAIHDTTLANQWSPDAENVYRAPEIRVLPQSQLPEHERAQFVSSPVHALKIFRGWGSWFVSLHQSVSAEFDDDATLTFQAFGDMVTDYAPSGKVYGTRALWRWYTRHDDGSERVGEWREIDNGVRKLYSDHVPLRRGATTFHLQFVAPFALRNSGIFVDDVALTVPSKDSDGPQPPVIEPPVSDPDAVYNIADYMFGDGLLRTMAYDYDGGGTYKIQTQREGERIYEVAGLEWRLWYLHDGKIYFAKDTTEGGGKAYVQQDSDAALGAAWAPAAMRARVPFGRNPIVTHFRKSDCVFDRGGGRQSSTLQLVAHHATITLPELRTSRGEYFAPLTVRDVIELQWDGGESYYFGRSLGLIAWGNTGNRYTRLAHMETEAGTLPREVNTCYEHLPLYRPDAPPPPEPPDVGPPPWPPTGDPPPDEPPAPLTDIEIGRILHSYGVGKLPLLIKAAIANGDTPLLAEQYESVNGVDYAHLHAMRDRRVVTYWTENDGTFDDGDVRIHDPKVQRRSG